jgi:hypothetical protein
MMRQQQALMQARIQGQRQLQEDRARAIEERQMSGKDDLGYYGTFYDDIAQVLVPQYLNERDPAKAGALRSKIWSTRNQLKSSDTTLNKSLSEISANPFYYGEAIKKDLGKLIAEDTQADLMESNQAGRPVQVNPTRTLERIQKNPDYYNTGVMGSTALSQSSGKISRKVQNPSGTGFTIVTEAIQDDKGNIIVDKGEQLLMSNPTMANAYKLHLDRFKSAGIPEEQAKVLTLEKFFPAMGITTITDNTPTPKRAAGKGPAAKAIVGQAPVKIRTYFNQVRPGTKGDNINNFEYGEGQVSGLSYVSVAKSDPTITIGIGKRYWDPENEPVTVPGGFAQPTGNFVTKTSITGKNPVAVVLPHATRDVVINGHKYRTGATIDPNDMKEAPMGSFVLRRGFLVTPTGPQNVTKEREIVEGFNKGQIVENRSNQFVNPEISFRPYFFEAQDLPNFKTKFDDLLKAQGTSLEEFFAEQEKQYGKGKTRASSKFKTPAKSQPAPKKFDF